jgi:malate/lactate dehydrogenase
MERGLCDEIVLIDVLKHKAIGEALDLMHCSSVVEKKVKVVGSDDYSLVKGSDLIIITAGVPRKPGQTRLDLTKKNAKIINEIIKKLPKEGLILVVTNPVDLMTCLALRLSGKDKSKVFGLGTMLDTIRFRSLCGDANVCVIGEHGNSMLPIGQKKFTKVFEAVKIGAAEVIKLKGATCFAPAVAVAEVVKCIAMDEKKVLPVSAYREEYGVCISLPSLVGREGVSSTEIALNEKEEAMLMKSIEVLREEIKKMKRLI